MILRLSLLVMSLFFIANCGGKKPQVTELDEEILIIKNNLQDDRVNKINLEDASEMKTLTKNYKFNPANLDYMYMTELEVSDCLKQVIATGKNPVKFQRLSNVGSEDIDISGFKVSTNETNYLRVTIDNSNECKNIDVVFGVMLIKRKP